MSYLERTRVVAALAALCLALGGCPAGGGGDDDDNDAVGAPDGVDVLWIVDNSNSMHDNQQALAEGFWAFVDEMTTNGPWVDYQMGITTTQSRSCDEDPTAFANCVDSVGNTGRLRGLVNAGNDTTHPPTLLTPGDPNLQTNFQALVDVGIDGSTEEYGLWIAAEAACASMEMPYDSDFVTGGADTMWDCSGDNWDTTDPWADFCRCYPGTHYDYNEVNGTRFLREDTALLVVIVSDEGDFTPNIGANGWAWDVSGCQIGAPWPVEMQDACADDPPALCENLCKIDHFLRFFNALDRRVVFAVIGPAVELDLENWVIEMECNEQNSAVSMLEFYLWAAELTDGAYIKIDERPDGGGCVDADFEAANREIAQLLIEVASGG